MTRPFIVDLKATVETYFLANSLLGNPVEFCCNTKMKIIQLSNVSFKDTYFCCNGRNFAFLRRRIKTNISADNVMFLK